MSAGGARFAPLSPKTEERTSATESLHCGFPVSKPPFCCTAPRSILTRAFVKPFLSSCPPPASPRFAQLRGSDREAKRGLTKARVKTERSAVQQKVALRWENHSANFRSQTCPPRFCWRAPPPPSRSFKSPPPACAAARFTHKNLSSLCFDGAFKVATNLSNVFMSTVSWRMCPSPAFLKAHPLHAPPFQLPSICFWLRAKACVNSLRRAKKDYKTGATRTSKIRPALKKTQN